MIDAQRISNGIVEKTVNLIGNKIEKVILYGSYARGDYTNESDVDIMILLKYNDEELTRFKKEINKLGSRESIERDVTVSVLLRSKKLFEKRKRNISFYRNVDNEGIVLYAR